jgi:hypothetical protein|tara:strand:+ start:518 stop:772 length:255 start_codon:yes stop_codon:yes gene_type:complete
MNKYIVNVLTEDEKDDIITYADSVEGVVENIINMSSIDKLFTITDSVSKEQWNFDEDIKYIRNLKNLIDDNIKLMFEVCKDDTV